MCRFGDRMVDVAAVSAVVKRIGIRVKHTKRQNSFIIHSSFDIRYSKVIRQSAFIILNTGPSSHHMNFSFNEHPIYSAE